MPLIDPTDLVTETRIGTGPEIPDEERPEIYTGSGRFHEIADEAQAALEANEPTLFISGERLVVPSFVRALTADNQPIFPPGLQAVSVALMTDFMSRHARFYTLNRRRSPPTRVFKAPSDRIARLILERRNSWQFPVIEGVISAPTITATGRIIAAPGYDPASRLWLHDPPALDPIPARPTKADAIAARDFLNQNILEGFHYADPADMNRAVGLSHLLSAVARAGLGCTPLHLTTAPEAGSGKSYIAECTSDLLIGMRAPVVGATPNPEEFDKRLDAVLLAARQITLLDNLTGEIESNTLCQILTQDAVDVRVFRTQHFAMMRPSGFWCANGNNVGLGGDLPRRTVHCRLDAKSETPWTLRYASNPLAFIRDNRAACLHACLVILRAFIVYDAEHSHVARKPPLNGFDAWSNVVRSAICWLGGPDIADTIESMRSANPRTQGVREFFEAWEDYIGLDRSVSTSQIIARLHAETSPHEPENPARDRFEQTLKTMTRDKLNPVVLGRAFGTIVGKISGPYQFTPKPTMLDGYRQWSLVKGNPQPDLGLNR